MVPQTPVGPERDRRAEENRGRDEDKNSRGEKKEKCTREDKSWVMKGGGWSKGEESRDS